MTHRSTLLDLREQHRRGDLDKHELSRRLSQSHAALAEHAALVEGTDIERIEISPAGVTLVSRFGGARFPCDPCDRGLPPVVALDFGSYEAKDFAMVRQLVPRGGTFVDIGANIGWYTVHVALEDPTARVIAVEPIPASFRWLTMAVAENALTNVTTLNAGVAAAAGEIELWLDTGISGAASSAPSSGTEGLERLCAHAVTIDGLVASHGGTASFVKIDIEGAELFALQGAERVLAGARPIVFAEMLRKLTRPFEYHPNDIIALMASHGYRCYSAVDRGLVAFESMTEETTETNFYFLHPEAHRDVLERLGSPESP
jgi:FkbM family methyltransferase